MRFSTVLTILLLATITFGITPYLSLMNKHVLICSDGSLKPYFDIFTGDLPYIVSYNQNEGLAFYLKLYMMFYMLPQETNTYIKFGKYPQIGYINEYSSTTPIYDLSLGMDPDVFINLTSKIKDINLGVKIYRNNVSFYGGINDPKLSFYFDYNKSLNLQMYYRFKDFYTFYLSLTGNKLNAGFGISWFNRSFFDLDKNDAKYFAHRGQINKYPENTSIAFKNTVKDNNYIGCEMDLNMTKDKKYAVIHDPFMFRFIGNPKLISQYNMKELSKIDISRYFHYKQPIHIIELKNIRPIFKNSSKIILLETKSCGSTEEDVKRFLKYVNDNFDSSYTIWFSSLDTFWVKEIKKLNTRKNSKVFYIYPFLMVSQSDYIYPLIYTEFEQVIKTVKPDGIIWFKPKVDLFNRIQTLSKKDHIDMLYWDFANQIYYYKYNK